MAFICLAATGQAIAGDDIFCAGYAKRAIEQLNEAKAAHCPDLTGPVWSPDYKAHLQWCLGVSADLAKVGTKQRDDLLDACRGVSNMRGQQCAEYARNATEQQRLNVAMHCGFGGARWTPDWQAHYNWCMHGANNQYTRGENDARDNELSKCHGIENGLPTKISTSGDLAADWCFDYNASSQTISFYPRIRNVGGSDWNSKNDIDYSMMISRSGAGMRSTQPKTIPGTPKWWVNKGETKTIHWSGMTEPFFPTSYYRFGWGFRHPEDTNTANNEMNRWTPEWSKDSTGAVMRKHPQVCSKTCSGKNECTNRKLLNLYSNEQDANGLPFNPKWGWQLEFPYGSPAYYPDAKYFATGGDGKHFMTYDVGFDPDLTGLSAGQISGREYGSIVDCGPHVNYMEVTMDGYIKWDSYDSNDSDANFYIFPPDGGGSTISTKNAGGIKVEFSMEHTIDNYDTPWWKQLRQSVYMDNFTGSKDKASAMVNKRSLGGGDTYAIVTGLFGLDCAHDCDSELHPAYAVALRFIETPNEEEWALFARNWGNEGYCSSHIFKLPLSREGDRDVYRVRLPWKQGAESVTWDSVNFMGTEDTAYSITEEKGKGVEVSFYMPAFDGRQLGGNAYGNNPGVNGQLRFKWRYPGGMTPKILLPPDLNSARNNARAASGKSYSEEEKIIEGVANKLPPNQRDVFLRNMREVEKGEATRQKQQTRPLVPYKPVGARVLPARGVLKPLPDTKRIERDQVIRQKLEAAGINLDQSKSRMPIVRPPHQRIDRSIMDEIEQNRQ